ncbi:TetR/AcrR family transcriptional regulator [Nocardia neocaledoniensis]|uniref:TetR/AcrR family transcriptional regulator n=1 Tax=Nocardia neocaledoniensis TaxID=236511 RepID=UPI0024567FE0|nr:TetR/AcrR family transcriptional regulator [Nocardia neocaledoniensis]
MAGARRKMLEVGSSVVRRVDARSSRWEEHRAVVRAELVDAAYQAFAKYGPEASMDDIAREAGATKPKLYRHFNDKQGLRAAVVERAKDLMWTNILDAVDFGSEPIGKVMNQLVEQYTQLVDEHRNVFKYLVRSHFSESSSGSDQALEDARELAGFIAGHFAAVLENVGADSTGIDLVVQSIIGASLSATDWWIDSQADPSAMSRSAFRDHLSAIIWGIIDASSRARGIRIDPTATLHTENIGLL